MKEVIASMSVSLDGFFTGPDPVQARVSARAARCCMPRSSAAPPTASS